VENNGYCYKSDFQHRIKTHHDVSIAVHIAYESLKAPETAVQAAQ